MRYTLLDMVQLILSSMDSDEVASISDTVESNQVALLLKSVYYDAATDLALPEHTTIVQLNPSLNPLRPCTMDVPDTVVNLHDVKYDIREDGALYPEWREICFKPLDEFLEWQQFFTTLDASIAGEQSVVCQGGTFSFMYRKDKQPEFYTTLDDDILIFDSYLDTIDTTLQSSKTLCKATIYPEFLMQDSFTPSIDPSQFSFLINRAKARAFYELKQQVNEEAAVEARRQKIIIQKRKQKTPDGPELWKTPRYGR